MATNEVKTAKILKARHNLSLDPNIQLLGETMADYDRRSFSNFVEVLIEKEYQRRALVSGEASGKVAA
jgi:hypothetical protein